ncbi:hypothetical protein [Streptomyces aurantiogriseus]|nr:hypothetical protein [Streptomyces aurantiogriseus]
MIFIRDYSNSPAASSASDGSKRQPGPTVSSPFMALPSHDTLATPDPEPGATEADDDTLIERLRARAWDPGLRFDSARVPATWIAERYGPDHAQGLPASWLYLTSGGGTMEWHVSLIAVDNPVLLYDADGWEPTWGEDAHDGLRHATALRRWLRTWADGGNVWDEHLDRLSDQE